MTRHQMINPETLGAPKGYSNGVLAAANGRTLFVAGQIGWDASQRIVSASFAAQFEQALANVLTVVRAANGEPADICRFTVYLTDRAAYLAEVKEIGAAYRKLMGKHFPAMAFMEVKALMEAEAKVEIEATAVIA